MNKILVRVISAIAIILLLFVILFRNRSPFGKTNSSFAVEPGIEISRIELSGNNEKLTLEKRGEGWFINGNSETRKSGILFIIRILREIRIKSPLSPELFNSEVLQKGIKPIKVKVYENRKLVKSFLVYKTRSNTYGNIMKMDAGAKPFIVHVPGFDTDIGSVFSINPLYWQPYTVFNLLPSEIASVDFENFSDTTNSFLIKNINNRYILSDRNRDLNGWDSALVSRYLSYFIRIPFESWTFDLGEEEKKIIKSRQPKYRISVTTVKGTENALILWEKLSDGKDSLTVDSDRLFGKTPDRDDFFIIRYFDIDPILKKRSYFFNE